MRKKIDKPDFLEEKKLWEKNFKYVIGVDEVGRGCFAGPVVAAACTFAPISNLKSKIANLGIDDSKRLKTNERERLEKEIKKYTIAWDVSEVGVSVVNKIGIGKATEKAMRKTIKDVRRKLELPTTQNSPSSIFVLIDAFYVKYLPGVGLKNQKPIKHGDRQSISIAAASILAKCHRDKLMIKFSRKYKNYLWNRNKGYGTKDHQQAIIKYGLTKLHRKQFIASWKAHKNEKSPLPD